MFDAKANQNIPLRSLVSPEFLREIHHFLWTEPQVADGGWNCRDHAWLVALLCESLGFKALLVHGEALFVRGASNKSAGMCYTQSPHQWVLVDGVGAIDLSIKPKFSLAGDIFDLSLKGVYANDWYPRGRGRVYFLEDAALYARAQAEPPLQGSHSAAVYFTHEAEHLHGGHISHSAGWIRSPLTVWLDAHYGDPCPLYAALLLHLHAFVRGQAKSLAHLPFSESWERIAGTSARALTEASQLLGTRYSATATA